MPRVIFLGARLVSIANKTDSVLSLLQVCMDLQHRISHQNKIHKYLCSPLVVVIVLCLHLTSAVDICLFLINFTTNTSNEKISI